MIQETKRNAHIIKTGINRYNNYECSQRFSNKDKIKKSASVIRYSFAFQSPYLILSRAPKCVYETNSR